MTDQNQLQNMSHGELVNECRRLQNRGNKQQKVFELAKELVNYQIKVEYQTTNELVPFWEKYIGEIQEQLKRELLPEL